MNLREAIELTQLMRCALEAELAVYEEEYKPGVRKRLEAFDTVMGMAEAFLAGGECEIRGRDS